MCLVRSPCPCLRPCNNASCHSDLMQHGELVRFKRGQDLWTPGTDATWLGVVCVGLIKLTRPTPAATDVIVDLVERSRIFGEEALVQGAVRPWAATAISGGRMIKLDGAEARARLQEPGKQALMEYMFSVMVERAQNMRHRVGDMTEGTVNSRLARVIIRLADRVGLNDSRGQLIPIRLTRSELAGF